MSGPIGEASPRLKARIAGGLWLAVIVTGIFAELFVRSTLIVSGDAAATARRIMASQALFRLGFVADLMSGVCYLGVIFYLYELLRPVSRSLSRLAAFFGVAGSAIFALNLVNMIAPLVLLGGGHGLAAFRFDQLQALAYAFLRLHGYGYGLSLVFFSGFYLSLVGVLVFRSTFLPRILGVLLTIAGVCYLIGCFADFLAPRSPTYSPRTYSCPA
ncbi:MAG: DUF4386 domain-containing protein [Caulobacteraceae bacterium]